MLLLSLDLGSDVRHIYFKKDWKKWKNICSRAFCKSFNYLQETIKLNHLTNVKPINKALYKDSYGTGFRSDLDHWLGGKIKIVSQNKVPTIDLNMLVKTENINQIDFVKLMLRVQKNILLTIQIYFLICVKI